MSTRAERWKARQQLVTAARPRLTVDGGRAMRSWLRRRYAVEIRGANFFRGWVPPRVLVGGQPVRELRFSPDGTVLRGVLHHRPVGRQIVVDYGFMRGEGRLDREASWWPSLLDLVRELRGP